MDVSEVLDDLIAEQEALDQVVSALDDADFALSTPSERWDVADQLGHLTYFDGTAALAINDTATFNDHKNGLVASFTDELTVDEATLGEFRKLSPAEQLTAWRHGRLDLEAAARTLSNDTRVEWYGPSMGAKSFLTARLMEVWAHGQDICDTVDASRPATDRLRHIAQLGFITRGWSYIVRGEQPPDIGVRVALEAPSGADWRWGDDDAADSVTGPAEHFCLVVTQRRHVGDTDLVVAGDSARDWMAKAQAFAGGATSGPNPKGTT